jgi:hypothetical protein
MIKESFPWLWAMKELIDMHPNFIPVGVGNNQMTIDMSEYTHPSASDSDDVGYDPELELEQSLSEGIVEREEDEGDQAGELKEEVDEPATIPTKRKANVDAILKKTPARAGISTPTLPADTKKPRYTIVDKFMEAAKAEEITIQRQLDLKRARIEADKETQVAKINASAKVQMSKYEARRRMKAEELALEKQKALMEHEFRMAQLNSSTAALIPQTSAHGRLPPFSSHEHLTSTPSSTGFNTLASSSHSHGDFSFDNFDFALSASNAVNLQFPFNNPGAQQTEDGN